MEQTLKERIIKIVANQLGISPAKISAHSKLKEDLGADSLDFVEIAFTVEEEFNICLDVFENTDKVETVETVEDFIKIVDTYINKQGNEEVAQQEVAGLENMPEEQPEPVAVEGNEEVKPTKNKTSKNNDNDDDPVEQLSIFNIS